MNKIRNYLNPAVVVFLLSAFAGASWAYALSREQLEMKSWLQKDPTSNLTAALVQIANSDDQLSKEEQAIIQAIIKTKLNGDEAQAKRIEHIIASRANNLDVQEICRNLKKDRTEDPTLMPLLTQGGMYLTVKDGIFPKEAATLTDILDCLGMKVDSNW